MLGRCREQKHWSGCGGERYEEIEQLSKCFVVMIIVAFRQYMGITTWP